MIEQDELLQAIDRIARTADGALLYLYLQRVETELPASPEPSDSALRANFGRRSLAAELMARMATGMSESGTGSPAERPVVFAPRAAASASRRESFRAHAIRTDSELTGSS